MNLKQETSFLKNEVERLTNFICGIESNNFVDQHKIIETQKVITFLLNRLYTLSLELESRA